MKDHTYLLILVFECICKDFVSASGYGNCKKTSPSIGKATCYVKQPSSCADLKNSKTKSRQLEDQLYNANQDLESLRGKCHLIGKNMPLKNRTSFSPQY